MHQLKLPLNYIIANVMVYTVREETNVRKAMPYIKNL